MSSANDLFVNGTELDARSCSILPPRVNKGGKGKTARVMGPNRKSLHFTAPLMLTWGVNDYENDDGTHKYSIPLQFPQDEYANENQRKFLDNMKELERFVIEEACRNSKEWMNKKSMTAEVAEALWTPLLKYPKNKETDEVDYKRPPTMKLSLAYWDEKFSVELFDTAKNAKGENVYLYNPDRQDEEEYPTPIDMIPKGSHVACMIRCNGVWFAGGKFGIKMTLVQAIVRRPTQLKGRCMVALDSTDEALVERETLKEQERANSEEQEGGDDDASAGHVEVEDDAEEETQVAQLVDDEDEEVPEPEPEPKKKRKTTKISKKKKA